MCDLVDLKVTSLRRVRIGRIKLGKLPLGQWRLAYPRFSSSTPKVRWSSGILRKGCLLHFLVRIIILYLISFIAGLLVLALDYFFDFSSRHFVELASRGNNLQGSRIGHDHSRFTELDLVDAKA